MRSWLSHTELGLLVWCEACHVVEDVSLVHVYGEECLVARTRARGGSTKYAALARTRGALSLA